MDTVINQYLANPDGNEFQEEVDYSKFEEVSYMYETPETGLFQSKVMIDGLDFASIESLKKEINEQYGIMVFKEDDEYDEDEVWTGEKITNLVQRGGLDHMLICTEGAYYWDDFDFEYEYVGTFNRQNVQRVKRLGIPEDKAMLIDGEIRVIKSGFYNIKYEEEIIINSDFTNEMFTIKLLSGKSVTIPNSPGVYRVYKADLALIDYK